MCVNIFFFRGCWSLIMVHLKKYKNKEPEYAETFTIN